MADAEERTESAKARASAAEAQLQLLSAKQERGSLSEEEVYKDKVLGEVQSQVVSLRNKLAASKEDLQRAEAARTATEKIAIEAQLAHAREQEMRIEVERGLQRLLETLEVGRRKNRMAKLTEDVERATLTLERLEREIRVAQVKTMKCFKRLHQLVFHVIVYFPISGWS